MQTTLYKVFKRRCRNWTQFVKARKILLANNLTYEEAKDFCFVWNKNRSKSQIRHNTLAEFVRK